MKISADQPSGLTALDRPNSYIGRSVPRPNLARLTQGRGQYVSDVVLPRMVHVAFVRSPHAHSRIKNIDVAAAKRSQGVVAIVTGAWTARRIASVSATQSAIRFSRGDHQAMSACRRPASPSACAMASRSSAAAAAGQ